MNSLLFQVFTAGVAIAIILTYIQPTFSGISARQDEIAKTQEEFDRVKTVNAKLAEVYAQLGAIPQSYRSALLTYLPDKVDEIKVLKELSEITLRSEVLVTELSYESQTDSRTQTSRSSRGAAARQSTDTTVSDPHTFNLGFTGSYEQVKETLALIEKNNYPLTVKTLTLSPAETGLIDVSLALETYSFRPLNAEVSSQ